MFNVTIVTIYSICISLYPSGHINAFVSQCSCIFKPSDVRKQTDMFI